MAVTLNALTTGVGGLQTTGDTSGQISLQSNGSTVLAVTASGVSITGTLSSTSALPIASGGTGQVTATAAFDALNPMTTGGDIIYESTPGTAARLPVGTTGQVLTVAGGLPSWAAAAGGSIQTQVFTTPGTWTKPSSVSQVRVTVIGGGAGAGYIANPSFPGSSGGTSSFGALASATGGSGYATPGVGSVSTGTALKTGGGIYANGAYNGVYPVLGTSIGVLNGNISALGLTGNPTFSTSGTTMAGAVGVSTGPQAANTSGFGGVAVGICPVTNPVAVTVGTGGAFNPAVGNIPNGSGMGGAVVVEFVG